MRRRAQRCDDREREAERGGAASGCPLWGAGGGDEETDGGEPGSRLCEGQTERGKGLWGLSEGLKIAFTIEFVGMMERSLQKFVAVYS